MADKVYIDPNEARRSLDEISRRIQRVNESLARLQSTIIPDSRFSQAQSIHRKALSPVKSANAAIGNMGHVAGQAQTLQAHAAQKITGLSKGAAVAAAPAATPAVSVSSSSDINKKIDALVKAYGDYLLAKKKAHHKKGHHKKRVHRKSRHSGGSRRRGGRVRSSGKVSSAGRIGTGQVTIKKTGQGVLSQDQVKKVIGKALTLNGIKDPSVRKKFGNVLMFMGQRESNFNVDAVNMTDSNAIGPRQPDGAPAQSSRGIWQTIPATFASNHVSGTSTNIYDPVANCAAAVRYIMGRYGVSANGAGLDAFLAARRSGGYTGY